MSAKSWYSLKSKAVPVRFGLSKNIQELLQALDDYHARMIDDAELGRLVRLSPRKRAAIANTITKCADIIKKQPEETKTCLDLIEMCTEILEIADRKPPEEAFPFTRLPMEIRERIISLMIDNVFHTGTIVSSIKKAACRCPKFDRDTVWQSQFMKTLPTLWGPALNVEFFQIFFRRKKFRFRCSCDLYTHLTRNGHLRENIKHIIVHWCGPDSVKAFKMLANCPRLENLTITVSKTTFTHLSERATFMRSYFPLQYRSPRMSDVLGLDELMELRGLKEVLVTRTPAGGGSTLTMEMDRAHLTDLLTHKCTLPKESKDLPI